MPIKSEVIANTKSERVHRVSELADRKGRKRSGHFMVEGPQSVRELLTYTILGLSRTFTLRSSQHSLMPRL